MYGRVLTITLDEVICALKAKELQKVNEDNVSLSGEGLMTKIEVCQDSRNKEGCKTKGRELLFVDEKTSTKESRSLSNEDW